MPAADAAGWERVDVPHDYQISQPWVEPSPEERPDNGDGAANFKSRLSARAFKEMGAGWYVKSYTPDASLKGQRLLLDFEGIMYVGDVYLNGERIGGTDYGYIGFEIDVTRRMRFDGENIIAVYAHTAEPANSRWYTGGGLFRDVTLLATNPTTYFVRHPLYITTTDNRVVEIQAEIATRAKSDYVPMRTVVRDADGAIVYERTRNARINRKSLDGGGSHHVSASARLILAGYYRAHVPFILNQLFKAGCRYFRRAHKKYSHLFLLSPLSSAICTSV